jgi:hypothetical protein
MLSNAARMCPAESRVVARGRSSDRPPPNPRRRRKERRSEQSIYNY